MKEPPPSRHRKKPSAAAVSSAVCLPRKQQHQLKLVCSFNGAFQFWPPSNKLRYVAGETRIVSVERNIAFSKLRSRISEFCLKSRRFSLKYKLPVVSAPADTAPLVSIDCDDDVRCMIEEHDRLELLGKRPRLWIFVCSPSDDDDDNIGNNVSDGGDDKTGKNDGAVNYGVDESLRKIFKQKLLEKTQFWERVPDFESSCGVCKQEYDHPLIDLAPVSNCMITGEGNVPGSESCCDLVQYPLDPRDGNMRLGANRFMLSLSGQNFHAWGNGNGIGLGNKNRVQKFNVASICNAVGADDAKQNAWDIGEGLQSNLNRENITPWVSVCDSQSCNSLWDRASYLVKSPNSGERVSGGYQNGNRSHRVVLNDSRNQRIYPYQIRTHRNNLVEMGNLRSARLDGRLSEGKCHPALGPYSNISKKGQPERSYCPNSWKPGLLQKVMKGKRFLMDSGSSDVNPCLGLQREQSNTAVSMDGNSNSEEYHLAYDSAGAPTGSQSPSCSTVIRNPSLCLRARESQQDLLTRPEYRKAEVSDQITYRNCQGAPTNNESVMYNQQKVPSISNSSNNIGSGSGERAECNKQLTNTRGDGNLSCCSRNGTYHLQGGIASSVDRLYNLSLSPSKEVKVPAFPSPASNNVAGALPKLESSCSDLMDEGLLGTSPIDDESNVIASTSLQDIVKVHKVEIYEEDIQQDCLSSPSIDQKAESKESLKCSEVFGGISSDPAAFYTHIATRELQTIKNSDLEYIKELGSGTYGTVYYGKWKGSDVAIKKIKPSCFGGGSLEGDRLVADFWREAHLLGQLHHPNIVAFYGVVTDGPVNNLATVTEYMVNGSLKQVLRRKDRTIDRRKRIIITMDAAIGMEYLHDKNIVHFDLKSHNFLVNMRDPQRPVCKIGDLGLSKVKQRTLISGGVRGTIPWMAPELLSAKDKMVTEKIDVYSFAIVMWELLTGKEPYTSLRSEEIIAGIIKGNLRPEIPCWCDPAWRSLMEKCWSTDPDCRPAFSEIAKELRSMAATMNIK